MSTTIRDLKDEEEEDVDGEEGEEEGEESEDEDFVPNQADFDEDSADEEDDEACYDADVPEVGGAPSASGVLQKKRARAKPKAAAKGKKKAKKGARKGGIALEEDDEAGASTNKGAEEEEEPSFADEPAAQEAAPAPPVKSSIDSLWAELNDDSAARKKPSLPTGTGAGGGSGDGGSGSGGGASSSALDIKALLAKTGGGMSAAQPTTTAKGTRLVEIQTTMDFCGEEVTITKKVAEGSKEELAYRQTAAPPPPPQPAASAAGGAQKGQHGGHNRDMVASALAASADLRKQMLRTDASLEFKGGLAALPTAKPPSVVTNKPTGLAGLLANIDGKKKMSTMEKSRHDW